MHAHTCTHTYTHTRTHTHTRMYTHTYTHVHMYAHVRTHTHTQTILHTRYSFCKKSIHTQFWPVIINETTLLCTSDTHNFFVLLKLCNYYICGYHDGSIKHNTLMFPIIS